MIADILAWIAGFSGVMALAQYLWIRFRQGVERGKDEAEFAYSRTRTLPHVTGVTKDGKVWSKPARPKPCADLHPTREHLSCTLPTLHVGVHQSGSHHWYGGVVFPNPGRSLADEPKINPFIPPKNRSIR